MFAGPNGSGKSTAKSVVSRKWLGIYLNPDDILREISQRGFLYLSDYGIGGAVDEGEIGSFFAHSDLLRKAGLASEAAQAVRIINGRFHLEGAAANAYHASVIADFLRRKLLDESISFSFETVMSSPDKVAFLKEAQARGFRTYLYYVATDDPAINVARVKARVALGGHDVPEEKIITRYHRSLDLLLDAVRHTNRAYLFDNSREGGARLWVAEVTDGRKLELKCDAMPRWFQKSVWEKI